MSGRRGGPAAMAWIWNAGRAPQKAAEEKNDKLPTLTGSASGGPPLHTHVDRPLLFRCGR